MDIRNIKGKKVEIEGGGVLWIAPALFQYQRERARLEREYRAAHSLAVEAPLPDGAREELDTEALIGTVLRGWEGWTDGEQPLLDRDEAGKIHRENARLLLADDVVWLAINTAGVQVTQLGVGLREGAAGN